jgi:uncharacterized protein DUF5995
MVLGVADVVRRMEQQLEELEAEQDPGRFFLGTYLRTTRTMAAEIDAGTFEDAEWVTRWDVAFADYYLDALAAHRRDPASAPPTWRTAFGARADLPPEAHVLLGMNAHINVDLPQTLIAVIPPADFANAELMDSRRRDHCRIDDILANRIAEEDAELQRAGGRRTLFDKAVSPLNRLAAKRMLKESRRSVWANTAVLHTARVDDDVCFNRWVADLEAAGCARVADLLRPGAVLVRMGIHGFGITLPADPPPPWD